MDMTRRLARGMSRTGTRPEGGGGGHDGTAPGLDLDVASRALPGVEPGVEPGEEPGEEASRASDDVGVTGGLAEGVHQGAVPLARTMAQALTEAQGGPWPRAVACGWTPGTCGVLSRAQGQGGSGGLFRAQGFSWVELMMVLGVVALLATLAWPSWVAHWQQVRRMQAQAQMVAWHVEWVRQVQASGAAEPGPADRAPPSPAGPAYDWVLERSTPVPGQQAERWVLWAYPRPGQAADPCGVIGLDESGLRYAQGQALWTGLSPVEAWRCWP